MVQSAFGTRVARRQAPRLLLVVTCLIGLVGAGMAREADGAVRTLPHPKGKVLFGVTDTGETEDFKDFGRAVGKRPAVIQTFHPWGNTLTKAMPRWRALKARPMLHITTKADDGTELITPLQIANGRGDDYLLRLNRVLARNTLLTYIRPMGEPNRCLNYYAGVDCGGNVRGGHYSFDYYRSAFRRIAIITRGGARRKAINRRLRAVGLPKIQKVGKTKRVPKILPAAPVSIVWSPLPAGSPITRSNWPSSYWPGGRWVDWVGTDFYSRYTNWKHLEDFHRKWAVGKKRPMALTEWGVWGADAPTFVRRLFGFVTKRNRVKMMVYYQDFGSSNEFRIQNFPLSRRILKNWLSTGDFPRYAPGFPRKGQKPFYPGLIPR